MADTGVVLEPVADHQKKRAPATSYGRGTLLVHRREHQIINAERSDLVRASSEGRRARSRPEVTPPSPASAGTIVSRALASLVVTCQKFDRRSLRTCVAARDSSTAPWYHPSTLVRA